MDKLVFEKKDLYDPIISTILKVEQLTATEKRFEIALPENQILNHKPGQFVEVSIFGFGEAPISISSSPTKSTLFDLTVRNTGGILTDKIANRNDFGRVIIIYGTKSPSEILFADEIKKWEKDSSVELKISVDRPDENWKGKVGVITTLIPPLKLDIANTIATIVGPPVMYKFVLMALKGKRLPDENIYLSLERRMKCGVGKCGHCQINDTYVCQDGPVFHYPRVKELKEAV